MRGVLAPIVVIVLFAPLTGAGELAGPIQGITISTHRGGGDWASDEMVVAMTEIRELGANWIAIHPYARIGADGGVDARYGSSATPPEHILRPIREAKALGLRILIKPHLAYWGSPFSWRGEIRFEREAEWKRFWNEYRAFILDLASWTKDADGFVVGTELRETVGHADAWRALIRDVRQQTKVPLIYAANWDDYQDVSFWDELDAIGIQAYFPLADETDQSEAAIRRGWRKWMDEVSAFAAKAGKPIVFTELGYNQAYHAPLRPWDYQTDDEGARPVQELCMRVALEVVHAEPGVLGVFLWKWFPPPRRVGRNFQLATPGIMGVIREQWLR